MDWPRKVSCCLAEQHRGFSLGRRTLLIWLTAPRLDARFYLAALLAALSPSGFLIAFLSRKCFAGTLSDPNGIPSARVRIFGAACSIDTNLAGVIVALFSLFAILAIYRA